MQSYLRYRIITMKTIYNKIAAVSIVAAALSSCSNDDFVPADGQGTVFISAAVSSDVKTQSRTDVDGYQLQALWIANSKGVQYEYKDLDELPAGGLKLLAGSYRAHAWVGDSVPASFDCRYFRGAQDFDIANGDKKSVQIPCRIVNTVVAVAYDASVDQVLSDYILTVGHSQGELTYEGRDDRRGYFMMNSRDKDLVWTLSGTQIDGSAFEKTGKIEACAPATLYTLNITFKGENSEVGGAYFTVSVDDTMIDVNDVVSVVAAPAVEGINFDINADVRGEAGKIGKKSVWITSSAPLDGVVLSCPYFATLFGSIPGGELGDFDLLRNTNPQLDQAVKDAGITYENFETDASTGFSQMKLVFGTAFTNSLPDGKYPVEITAIDSNDKRTTATLNIVVSADPVSITAVNPADVWATKATVTAVINKADAANPCIKYRKLGTSTWTVADNNADAGLAATITGLEPGTVYEYCAATDDYESEVLSFTTESATQLSNASFEDVCKVRDDAILRNKDVTVFAKNESEWFWDCGNWGSMSMSKEVTEHSSDKVHEGSYSVALKSQFVGIGVAGKFAAGNIFIGKYLETLGTNGRLGWGRPWSSRPVSLHGWYHYTPVAVTHDNNKYTDLKKGDMDKAIIYIALLDDQMVGDSNEYPVTVNTKTVELFNENGSNVIAFGKLVIDQATSGDAMVPFEITLDYRRTDVKPSYIMCTASASIGGDYFVGGNGSTMYLDDLELVY